MSKVCKKHRENPALIYNQCVGCELERMAKEIQILKQQRDELVEKLKKHVNHLHMRWREANEKWEMEGDTYQQGMETAYDIAENLLSDILRELEVVM